MRNLLFFLGILLSVCLPSHVARAAQGVVVNTATNPVLPSFTTAFPQLAMTLLGGPNVKHLYVFNGATGPLALSFTSGNSSAVAPSSNTTTNPQQVFVGASSSTQLNYIGAGQYIWLRSATAAANLSSGVVIIDAW